MSDRVCVLKIVFGEDIRRVKIQPSTSYDDVLSIVCKAYGLDSCTLKYTDDEDEVITVASEMDFREAITLVLDGTLKSLKLIVNTIEQSQPKQYQSPPHQCPPPYQCPNSPLQAQSPASLSLSSLYLSSHAPISQLNCSEIVDLVQMLLSDPNVRPILPNAVQTLLGALHRGDSAQSSVDEALATFDDLRTHPSVRKLLPLFPTFYKKLDRMKRKPEMLQLLSVMLPTLLTKLPFWLGVMKTDPSSCLPPWLQFIMGNTTQFNLADVMGDCGRSRERPAENVVGPGEHGNEYCKRSSQSRKGGRGRWACRNWRSPSAALPLPMARFIKDATIPDRSHVFPCQTLIKTWLIKNSGAIPWPTGTKLVFVKGDLPSIENEFDVRTNQTVLVNQTVEISAVVKAPPEAGRRHAMFRLRDPDGNFFGPRLWCDVIVVFVEEKKSIIPPNEMEKLDPSTPTSDPPNGPAPDLPNRPEPAPNPPNGPEPAPDPPNGPEIDASEVPASTRADTTDHQRFKDELTELANMGWRNTELNCYLLKQNGGRVEKVCDWLLKRMEDP